MPDTLFDMIARGRFRLRGSTAGAVLLVIASIGSRAQTAPPNNAGTSSVTIQASVREVLVPVVVTDKKGHYITNLKPTDFRVYEDGVPQTIAAFSSAPDTMVLRPDGTTVTHVEPAVLPGFEPKAPNAVPRRTYLICVDTLHSSFANFARVRQALHKFFEQEEGGDSQYALMALGRELTVLHDSTRNSADILAAIDSKQFLKTIQNSEASGIGMDVQRFNEAMGALLRALRVRRRWAGPDEAGMRRGEGGRTIVAAAVRYADVDFESKLSSRLGKARRGVDEYANHSNHCLYLRWIQSPARKRALQHSAGFFTRR